MTLKYKAVFFDMDGVILDSMRYHVMAWKKALFEGGCHVNEEILYLHEGAIEPDVAVEIFHRAGCDICHRRFDEIFSRQKEIFISEHLQDICPYPEVEAVLEALEGNDVKVGIVTSTHQDMLEHILPDNIKERLSFVITGDNVRRRKPFPDPYLKAMSCTGFASHECLVIENAPAGIKAAKAANIPCAAIATTLHPHHLQQADFIVQNHSQLFQIIFDAQF